MQVSLNSIGANWLLGQVDEWVDHIEYLTPVAYNEKFRYLPESVTKNPGPYRVSVAPYTEEILNCFDVRSPVREVNIIKGTQIGASLIGEGILFYFGGHIKTVPICYTTVDAGMSIERFKLNILPMYQESGLDMIQSNDLRSRQKTGATKSLIQFKGGGFLMGLGAMSPGQMRNWSFQVMVKDEIEGWPAIVMRGKDGGEPDHLTDNRLKGYWQDRKILRLSTPVYREGSRIDKLYSNGDHRKYMVRCIRCGYPQELRWEGENKETGKRFGFEWEFNADGSFDPKSTRYHCANCRQEHYEHDKVRLFSKDHGAHWKPTATPKVPHVRSYHIPAFYSPIGARPWSDCAALYLKALDPKTKKVRDIGAYQAFYNDVLGRSFEQLSEKIHFTMVSAHRRTAYTLGQIPNRYAALYTAGKILMLTCQIDVHLHFLAVKVTGWTRGRQNFVVDYYHLRDDSETGCIVRESPVWSHVQKLIEEKEYTADDGTKYSLALTFIDSQYEGDVVKEFCAEYDGSVYPIRGVDKAPKTQKINEFAEFKTKFGTLGYAITVDYYKDRIAPVLRREWREDMGQQDPFHFNAPMDISDKSLKELTVENKRRKTDKTTGVETTYWYRPNHARNELWDLLVYGHAAVEIFAWSICIKYLEAETMDWQGFWDFIETPQGAGLVCRVD